MTSAKGCKPDRMLPAASIYAWIVSHAWHLMTKIASRLFFYLRRQDTVVLMQPYKTGLPATFQLFDY